MKKICVSILLISISFSASAITTFLPTCLSGQIIEHTHYSLCFQSKYHLSSWAAYHLNKNFIQGTEQRSNDYREDPFIQKGAVKANDYYKSGFDRGHMVPAADMKYDFLSMSETFYMSNMTPQRPSFNRGIWKRLESLIRKWTVNSSELYIITGAVLNEHLPRIKKKVTIPKYYFKVVYDFKSPKQKMIAFLLPAKKTNRKLKNFALSVRELELITGINFFHQLNEQVQKLEIKVDVDRWLF